MTEILIPVERMSRDIRAAATTLSTRQARFLVDAYYQFQEDRKRADGRIRALSELNEPHSVINWLSEQSNTVENQIKGALDRYTGSHAIGSWMREIKGIGPVIAAGFLANLAIRRTDKEGVEHIAQVAGSFWSVCGLVPGKDRRRRGEKANWNPALKRICWIAGESFKKLQSSDEDAYYRHIYDERKTFENAQNEAGAYAEQAARELTEKKFGDDTKAKTFYAAGKLPPGHIDRRAARYAVKQFLSDLHTVWYEYEMGTPPPKPYVIEHMGHVHLRVAPHVQSMQNAMRRKAA